ncbi:ABC-2 type transport system ATP-binding protein [Bowdeniella nasicola]|uniref:ABC-2 type transport system ATP-binding protein n=1 Tax=Bowdeniella nasicola TaxID=208480 RepID=A0A1H4A240_9ACTO|nr:ABC transporter ATP-binding protein [Bowdeniella nasicola]SEA30055.1 ABC-2 type transport system ATP-binding protein [Bowdeniella nasicola]
MNTAVLATDLTKIFSARSSRTTEEIRAVDGVSFDIARGTTTAILGPNGAGKTTTIEMMLGLQLPTSGSVRVLGGSPTDRAVRARVGAMLQDTDAPTSLTAAEILDLVGHYYPAPLPVAEVLDFADLTAHRTKTVGQLSGGQRQRLSFGIAIIGDPDVLYLDEPTAALDVMARRRFWEGLAAFTARGATVIFSSHNLAEVEANAERVIMLAGGRIVADGSPTELAAKSARMVLAFQSDAPAERFAELAGVIGVEQSADGLRLAATDADAAVAALVTSGLPFSQLTVTRASLEDAFIHVANNQKVEAHA